MIAAATNPLPDVVDILLTAGADVHATARDGNTAFSLIQSNPSMMDTAAYYRLRDLTLRE